MEEGAVAGPIQTPTGPAFVTVIGRQEPVIPPLEDVRDDVRRDVLRRKALELARERADEAAGALAAGDDFRTTAEAAELTVAASGLIARGAAFPEVGVSPALERTAFALPPGGVSGVVETGGDALAVVHLVEREDVTDEQVAEARDTLRAELLQNRQNEFYSSYMSQVQQRLSIDIDYQALELAVGA